MRALEAVTQLAMGLWVGAAAGFALGAPKIFAAFGSDRQAAGDLAGDIIYLLNNAGLLLGAVALLALLPRLRSGVNKARLVLLLGCIGIALTTWLYIFPQMERAQPPEPIQNYAETDPLRVAYNRWHTLSERVAAAGMLLGTGVIVLGPFAEDRRGRR
ncbi:hypothetical protein J2Z79_001054 [Symbiobacterium terraclitae]|uniref:TMEM205-like domain-containing protein n=1 Tax=Symbiobacterium terraclitae TaxID=557451 RepID=A0ABS4JQ56_9FIRM|nr:DUF4149 domain-containing protein [Symbiobacterium terraclitae]MBP2017669.1 hypothetical protein [Symbiobacterium terraclitae]